MATFTVKIDQLPPETIEAADAREAAHKVHALLTNHDKLKKLDDEEPVEIKKPDGIPWGRHMTIGDFRAGLLDNLSEADAVDGPQLKARP